MDLLETLEALRPLQQCVQLLVRESDAAARVEAEVLVGKTLAHEHMRRRRSVSMKRQMISDGVIIIITTTIIITMMMMMMIIIIVTMRMIINSSDTNNNSKDTNHTLSISR